MSGEKQMKQPHAGEYYWTISLDVDCPKCEYRFDANDVPDIWDGCTNYQMIKDRLENLRVDCPECNHIFYIDIGDGC